MILTIDQDSEIESHELLGALCVAFQRKGLRKGDRKVIINACRKELQRREVTQKAKMICMHSLHNMGREQTNASESNTSTSTEQHVPGSEFSSNMSGDSIEKVHVSADRASTVILSQLVAEFDGHSREDVAKVASDSKMKDDITTRVVYSTESDSGDAVQMEKHLSIMKDYCRKLEMALTAERKEEKGDASESGKVVAPSSDKKRMRAPKEGNTVQVLSRTLSAAAAASTLKAVLPATPEYQKSLKLDDEVLLAVKDQARAEQEAREARELALRQIQSHIGSFSVLDGVTKSVRADGNNGSGNSHRCDKGKKTTMTLETEARFQALHRMRRHMADSVGSHALEKGDDDLVKLRVGGVPEHFNAPFLLAESSGALKKDAGVKLDWKVRTIQCDEQHQSYLPDYILRS